MPVTRFDAYINVQTGSNADIEKLTQSIDRLSLSIESTADKSKRALKEFEQQNNSTTGSMAQSSSGAEKMALRFGELATAIGGSKAALAGMRWGTTELLEHVSTLDKTVDTYRALRLAISPTLFTAGTIAIGLATEAAIKLALAQGKLIEQDALFAARNKQSFTAAQTFGLAGSIQGEGRDSFQSLFKEKEPIQVIELIDKFKDLKDPVDRAALAVKNFGADAEKALPLLRDRLRENVSAAYELSQALDSRTRASLETIKEELGKPAELLGQLADSWRKLKEEAKQRVVFTVVAIHDTIGTAPPAELVYGMPVPTPKPPIPSDIEFAAMLGKTSAELLTSRLPSSSTGTAGAPLGKALGIAQRYSDSLAGIQSQISSKSAQFQLYASDPSNPLAAGPLVQLDKQLTDLKAKETAIKNTEAAERSLVSFESQMGDKQLSPIDRIFAQRDALVASGANAGRATDAALLGALPELNKLERSPSLAIGPGRDSSEFQGFGLGNSTGFGQLIEIAGKSTKSAQEAFDEYFKPLVSAGGTASANFVKEFIDYSKKTEQVADEIDRIKVSSERSEILARSDRATRLFELGAGPGQEGQAIAAGYAERKRLAYELFTFEDAHAHTRVEQARAESDLHKAMYEAAIENELKIATLQKKRVDDVRNTLGGIFDAAFQGPKGIEQFFQGIAKDQARKIFEAVGADVFKGFSPFAGSSNKYLQGTLLGKDPLQDVAGGKLFTAGDHLTTAAGALIGAAHSLSLSVTSGGGGVASGLGARLDGIFSDLPLTHSSPLNDLSLSPAFGADVFAAGGKSSSLFSAKNIGSVAAGAGAAFGAYESFKSGGVKGALGGIGALAGGAALFDPEPISKAILAGISIGAGALVSIFPGLDPKAQRAKDLQNQAQSRAFTAPVGASYSGDTRGGSDSYDFQGGIRSITIINHVHAMDGPSLQDFLVRNPTALSTGMTNAFQSGNAEDVLGTLRSTL